MNTLRKIQGTVYYLEWILDFNNVLGLIYLRKWIHDSISVKLFLRIYRFFNKNFEEIIYLWIIHSY